MEDRDIEEKAIAMQKSSLSPAPIISLHRNQSCDTITIHAAKRKPNKIRLRGQEINPVSYTHLDVYKRQVFQNRRHMIFPYADSASGTAALTRADQVRDGVIRASGGAAAAFFTFGRVYVGTTACHGAVSYTHLDVYKRQG